MFDPERYASRRILALSDSSLLQLVPHIADCEDLQNRLPPSSQEKSILGIYCVQRSETSIKQSTVRWFQTSHRWFSGKISRCHPS
jgi:hypothetical protein